MDSTSPDSIKFLLESDNSDLSISLLIPYFHMEVLVCLYPYKSLLFEQSSILSNLSHRFELNKNLMHAIE